ncbi:hypothetical protein ADUPG1_014150 [Aduncisulcus paluster]|uniref:Uncharacterized protein n=1 Tax=Aduncisulcus paluster TaxID=2918883 RepID=A0ABQ5KAY1_9EUKA|nr:hypothetical protein ADUPG1_014150 [Aduncisulcus paluster]|eukprot:gnl/Carplike_NY0171/1560_a2115_747.p1 GENE.gnl/Carplike_NY0171/1560_a2115_747~~gnl/Carplike_NY0171/1560_a2115_747.p1  ORF type:complete len:311 (+),score=35.05 gnl/Carplike_NY0171/1560_a2115_747:541-1473(+)
MTKAVTNLAKIPKSSREKLVFGVVGHSKFENLCVVEPTDKDIVSFGMTLENAYNIRDNLSHFLRGIASARLGKQAVRTESCWTGIRPKGVAFTVIGSFVTLLRIGLFAYRTNIFVSVFLSLFMLAGIGFAIYGGRMILEDVEKKDIESDIYENDDNSIIHRHLMIWSVRMNKKMLPIGIYISPSEISRIKNTLFSVGNWCAWVEVERVIPVAPPMFTSLLKDTRDHPNINTVKRCVKSARKQFESLDAPCAGNPPEFVLLSACKKIVERGKTAMQSVVIEGGNPPIGVIDRGFTGGSEEMIIPTAPQLYV